ncbi:plasmid maintenance system killer [Marinobacter psychrophilus]|uniref:Plasmid maintenance system killer n=1 Tax=Marinobacter psychrophilus TaxID=330734 RepID=A0A0H4I8I7_9GAMM|nr:plasmid maintenance system killer [Marinobacter psychrophilus]
MIILFKCKDTEKLAGGRRGQHRIRINKQLRVCFRWTKAGAEDVEIIDYH